ncbi:MAG: tannase/feruloyl esterase family alpha/beta hydrolase [Anaerolineae bacterium]
MSWTSQLAETASQVTLVAVENVDALAWQLPASDFGVATVSRPFVRVVGRIAPAINFEVWLPPEAGEYAWNGRFLGVGNGGLAGSLNYPAMADALARGYATASTDTGHQAAIWDASWMMGNPDALADFGYRAIHEMSVAAFAIVRAYYGRPAALRYFTGCSGGGHQGLVLAQRYPDDYDGIVVGAPANFPTHMWPGETYAAWLLRRSPDGMALKSKLPMLHQAVVAACGDADGAVGDPPRCDFDPRSLVRGEEDTPDSLTPTQAETVARIYAGLRDPSTGEQFWPGYEPGSELGWADTLFGVPGIPTGYFKYLIFGDPDWDWLSFDFTDPKDFARLVEAHAKYAPVLNSTDPDLSAFKARDGKLLMYHGWAAQNIAPRNSVNYYESVVAAMGEAETRAFMRLFMVPSLQHCRGGEGATEIDPLSALERWVEDGAAPDSLTAAHVTPDGTIDYTRAIYPYSLV